MFSFKLHRQWAHIAQCGKTRLLLTAAILRVKFSEIQFFELAITSDDVVRVSSNDGWSLVACHAATSHP